MKYLKLLPLLVIVLLASCKLDPAHTYYNNVVVPIDESVMPATGLPGEPFNIYAHVTLENSCWSNIRFYFDTIEDRSFQIFAIADYANAGGGCADITLTDDTIITLTPDLPGVYYLRTWMSTYEYNLDSLVVVEPL